MSNASKFRNNVSYSQYFSFSSFIFNIVQFEEKKFLEAARKTIQSAVAVAGQKLESESILNLNK